MPGKKIIIVHPVGKKGGQLVLTLLCHLLIERGYDAKLLHIPYEPTKGDGVIRNTKSVQVVFWFRFLKFQLSRLLLFLFPRYRNNDERSVCCSFSNLRESYVPLFLTDDYIVIYPERVYGNPFFCKNVIRYFMYYNPYSNDSNAYGVNDLFFCYRRIFNDPNLNPKEFELNLHHFDNTLYKQYNYGKRTGNCYIVRKGRKRKDIPNSFDGPIIDNYSEEEKVKVLNECEFCYSYDTQTFYVQIAAVCGCIPVVLMESGKKKEDYISEEDETYGIAYGSSEEEIRYAIETRDSLLSSLNYEKKNNKEVDRFIEIVSERFGGIKKIN